MKRNHFIITLGVIWTVIFAGMSFYWAMGGLVGVRSLGGSIYEMSLNPSPSFVTVVWLSGVIKLLGIVLFWMLYRKWNKPLITRMLYYIMKIAGIFLFLYGLLNFITISLSAFNVLDFDLDSYATFWRLVFWEPFWMIGGIFYFYSVKRIKGTDWQRQGGNAKAEIPLR
ncbi:DUF3995 domain-containing protein [Virgibacillus kimchii]